MSDSADLLAFGTAAVAVKRLTASPLLVDALADLAGAGTAEEVAAVTVEHAAALTGARASALGVLTATRTELRLLGSTGYNCDSMAVGTRLPLDAGLPITDAARGGRPIVRTAGGGGWTAVPLAGGSPDPMGALLVSLAPGTGPVDVALLADLAGHARRALHRCRQQVAPRPSRRDGAVGCGLAGVRVAVRSDPLHGAGGGDLVETVGDGAGGLWLLVADVCGNDPAAHDVARTVRLLTRALAPHNSDPAELLHELDRLLADDGCDRYVTALAVRVTAAPGGAGVRLAFASAGHPLPVVVGPGGGVCLGELHRSGLPLNLGLAEPVGATRHELNLAPGHTLLAYTDGLTDRRDRYLPDNIVADVCANASRLDEPSMVLETVFDVLTAAQGPAGDDAAAVLLRVG